MTSMFLKPKWKITGNHFETKIIILKFSEIQFNILQERARSAFKLIEIDNKYKFLKPGDVVVECGAAPGAWTQVCVKRINATGQSRQFTAHI